MQSRCTIVLFVLLLCLSCDKVEYSPNQVNDSNTPHEINKRNIEKLISAPSPGGKIRIAFTGDSQRYYDDAVAFKDKVNSIEDIDFVLLAGDISDFGLKQEFEWIDEIFSKLNRPYIGIIGNHDHGNNGEKVFRYMFGEPDFTFIYKHVKFVCHNTNSREYNFSGSVPNLSWIKEQFAAAREVNYYVAVSHVPPFDADFDRNLERSYADLFKTTPGFLISLHGHRHISAERYPYGDSVCYLNSNAINKREFILLDINDGKIHTTFVPY